MQFYESNLFNKVMIKVESLLQKYAYISIVLYMQ